VDPMRAVGAVLILAAACGESTDPSAAGAVRVQVWAGEGISLGGEYRVRLDGRWEVPLSEPAGAVFSPVSSGEHLVTLDGYPARCQVEQGPARTVVVTAGDTATTRFDLTCANDSGGLLVRISVRGEDQDPNGYTVVLDGHPQGSELFGSIALQAVEGRHTVELTELTPSCHIRGDAARSILVPSGGSVTEDFEIECALAPRAGRGREIAFETNRAGADSEGRDSLQLYSVNTDGTGVQLIPAAAGPRQTAASWSPDGTRLLFTAESEGFESRIFMVNADGSGATPYLDAFGEAAWSPDMSLVAMSLADPGGEFAIATVPFENPDLDDAQYFAFSSFISRPTWSPDGGRLAFMRSESVPDEGSFLSMEVLDLSTGERETLPLDLADLGPPQWSPDGEWLLFAGAQERFIGPRDLFLVHPDGTGLTRLTETPEDEATPTWSPDGTQIAFASSRSGNYEIYVMNADGTQPIRLTNHPGLDIRPAWRP
jgi:WD40 repeat protein